MRLPCHRTPPFRRVVRVKGNTFTGAVEVRGSSPEETGFFLMTISPAVVIDRDLLDTYLPDLATFAPRATTPSTSVHIAWSEDSKWVEDDAANYLEEHLPGLIEFLDQAEAGILIAD